MSNCNCGCEPQSFVRIRYQEQPPKCVAKTVYHSVPQPPLKIIDTYEKVSSVVQEPCPRMICDCGCGS
jgi:hypothetical protein